MASSPVSSVLDRLPTVGSCRAELSIAAYRSTFPVDRDDEE